MTESLGLQKGALFSAQDLRVDTGQIEYTVSVECHTSVSASGPEQDPSLLFCCNCNATRIPGFAVQGF